MTKILFLDLDGTVRRTKSGATFINDPYDQDMALYPNYEYLIVGDRPEDQQCAANANIPFMWAEEWRNGK